ncbi:MAG TPA: hypothetical protein VNU68_21455 [Verrucomicrobiae bacterium]|nr:hypothetical protein [Verrucomicrobiae bacterium]
MTGNDEFYIGWEEKAPAGVGSRVRWAVVLLLALAVALGVILSLAQRTIGVSVFEWGKVKSFSGILKSQPYPHLLVPRPGASDGQAAFSSYYLVKPFKFGIDAETANRLDGSSVSLRGTLIYRGGQTMIEVVAEPIKQAAGGGKNLSTAQIVSPVSLGEQTLIGEIVDSKCYLGVMNPGALTPHRACAIRCISGGIPPVLLVRQSNGPALYLLLVSRDGKPVNKQVLNLVAEPVSITGEVQRQGDLLILRADPAVYRRLKG